MKKMMITVMVMLGIAMYSPAQNVGINNSGNNPNSSAGLDVDFTNKGVLIPRVNITDLSNISPITGGSTESLLVYNTNTSTGKGYYYWDGSKWIRIYDDNSGKEWKIAGNNNITGGTHFLGTTNSVAVDFRTNNTNRFRIPNANQVHAMSDGTATLPFYSFTNNTNMGMFRAGTNQLGFSTGSAKRFHIENTFIQSVQNHRFANGTAASPSITFTSNTGTGLFRPGANILAFSTSGAERMRIDANGRVLVNTTSNNIPSAGSDIFRFLVWETGSESAAIGAYHSGTGPGLFVDASASNNTFYAAEISGNTTDGAGISATGGVGARITSTNGGSTIETTNPGAYYALVVDYDAISGGGWWTASDLRFKKNIKNLDDEESFSVLNKVLQLRPVTYNWKVDEYPGLHLSQDATKIGFIAQELNELFPELVSYKNIRDPKRIFKNGEKIEYEKYYAVNYAELTPILTQAIQEQQTIIESQKSEIDELRERLERLEQLIQD